MENEQRPRTKDLGVGLGVEARGSGLENGDRGAVVWFASFLVGELALKVGVLENGVQLKHRVPK